MKNKILIFHFLPLEIYPPVLNILNYFVNNDFRKLSITVITTYSNKNLQLYDNENIKIVRCKIVDSSSSSILKAVRYFNIYIVALYHLVRIKPNVVFYFETLSSLSPLIYKWIYKKTKLYIHYHEFVTLAELSEGRLLNRKLNQLERMFYKKASWISHTNTDRQRLFAEEYKLNTQSENFNVLPNFPSKKWIEHDSKDVCYSNKIRLLHIGALSFENMYLESFLNKFGDDNRFDIHFYSHTTDNKIISKINSYNNVEFKGSLNYDEIVQVKGLYDVGLVLYKGNSLNVKYCAPNKIFEYLALDLDVWCSDKLITAQEYIIEKTFPKMLLVDFANLDTFDFREAMNRNGLYYKQSPYFCEEVYATLLEKFDEDINT